MKSPETTLARLGARLRHLLTERSSVGRHTSTAIAVVLIRVANADHDVAEDELDAVRDLLRTSTRLGPEEVGAVMAVAIESVLRESDEATAFDSLSALPSEEKRWLLQALHAVAEADGEFSESELDEIDRIVAALDL